MNERTITVFATIPAADVDAGAALLKLAAAQLAHVGGDGKVYGLRGCEVAMVVHETLPAFSAAERAELDRVMTDEMGIFGL